MNLANVNLTPTMRCNLKCALCGVLVPQYDYRPQMDEAEFQRTLDALFSVVDHVGRLQITGGEPLLHPALDRLLSLCFQHSDRFDALWLFSNCAVPIRDSVLAVLSAHREKIMVHCSDYGVRPEVARENQRRLEEAELPFRYLKYHGDSQYCDGWVDNGDFLPHHRTPAENEAVFSACSHVNRGGSWYIRGGQMHWCGRSIRGSELGKIPLRETDYLDLFDENTSVAQKRKKMECLTRARSITACDYCNGLYGTTDPAQRHPAGEQLT